VLFTDGDLELSEYENVAREFGYSETSFIYYSTSDKALKVRSFTPTGFEINGAGHNLLGAVCAALLTGMEIFDEQGEEKFVIMRDEAIHISVNITNNKLLFVGMMQQPAIVETLVPPQIIAAALNLNQDEVSFDGLFPTVVKTEVAHLMLPVVSLEALNKCASNKALLIEAANKYGFEGVYCFTILNRDPQYFAQTRFFNPGIGIDEDPATGSAAGPLAGFLFKNNRVYQNTAYQILQGVKMNQPSSIQFEVKNEGIWISGSSVIVMEGNICL
jgi:PhzF family phenazine biosynthesis protein